jgi:predicted metal-dependent hydrolase
MTGTLTYGADTIRYEVRFLASRQTLAIEVHPDSRVLVRAPLGCPEALIAERVKKRAGWISRQLAEFERYRPRTPARQYVNGESHLYLGRQYRLKLVMGDTTNVTKSQGAILDARSAPAGGAPGMGCIKLTRGQLLVMLPGESGAERGPDQVRALLHRWYLDRARAVFTEVLDASLLHFKNVEQPRLIVRAMQSRWGSLSRAGSMTLNVNLVRAPRPCIEYVVIHELCHTKHRDHDARFFKLLGQVMPDWEQRKQRLEAALL